MKANGFFKIAAMVAFVSVVAICCGSGKQVADSRADLQQRSSVGLQTSIPCFEMDTDEYYTGFGSFNGSVRQQGRLVNEAARLAQTNLVEKMAHTFNGFVEQSSHSVGNNSGNDVGGAIKSAGLAVIKAEVARLRVNCSSQDQYVDANGNITVYVSYRMYLKDVAAALLASSPKDNLTKEEREFEEWKHAQSQEQLQKYIQENLNK